MILIAVGDFNSDEMLAKLKAKFGGLAEKRRFPARRAARSGGQTGHIVLVDKPDATQTQVHFARTPPLPAAARTISRRNWRAASSAAASRRALWTKSA